MTRAALGRDRQVGFTLLELMVVVAIIGLLASVAIPNYQRLLLRAKTAERTTVMYRIKQQVQDYYMSIGTSIPPPWPAGGAPPPAPAFVFSEQNPPPPPGAAKRMLTLDGNVVPIWAQFFPPSQGHTTISAVQSMEGTLYYTYQFFVWEGGGVGASQIQVWAWGDLDSDGVQSSKWITWSRINGTYQIAAENPPPGQEDSVTF